MEREVCCVCSRPAARQGADQPFDLMGGHNNVHEDSYGSSSQDGTMMMREVTRLTVRALNSAFSHRFTRTCTCTEQAVERSA